MNFKEFLIILTLIGFTLAPVTQFNNNSGMGGHWKETWEKMDRNLLEIYEFLRRNEKEPLIVMENVYSPHLHRRNGYFNPFSAFTGHYSLLSDDARLIRFGIFEDEIMKRRKDIETFYGTDSLPEHERILKEYMISYVIDDGSLKITEYLNKVKAVPPFILYKVTGLRSDT